MMIHEAPEEKMAFLAHDVFAKRQRLIAASEASVHLFDDRSAQSLEAEYRTAESEYLQAKAAFARAMKGVNRDS